MEIREGLLDHSAVVELLRGHLGALARLTPVESMHALDIERLKSPTITFWTAWDGDEVLGCAALRRIDPSHGELASMRTAPRGLRRGVGSFLLGTAVNAARLRG